MPTTSGQPDDYLTDALVDGGVSADVPVLQAEALGAQVTYVLPAAVEDPGGKVRGPMASACRALAQMLEGIAGRDIGAASGQVIVLPTVTSQSSSPMDFRDTPALISAGYRLTSEWLSQHAAVVAA